MAHFEAFIIFLLALAVATKGKPVVVLGKERGSFDYTNNWLTKLLLNIIGYSIIVLPLLTLVFLVKNKLCLCSGALEKWSIIRVLVYGKLRHPSNDESLHKILEDSGDLRSRLPQSFRSKSSGHSRLRNGILLAYCFLGLQLSYLTWGILQERIMTTEYVIADLQTLNSSSQPHEALQNVVHFRDSQFLVLINRILAFVFAIIAMVVKRMKGSSADSSNGYIVAPLYEFVFCSLSNILSSWCQYEALKFVNFPTQVLSKACKILPVMLMSQLIGGKKYQTKEYVFAVTISIGMCFFLFGEHKGDTKGANVESSYNLLDGLFVLALYLTFDSFTSNWQGKLFDKYGVSSFQMMAIVNFFSLLLTFTSLTEQGDLLPAFKVVLSSFQLAKDCFILSLCSASGQLFVFYTISTFGPIVFVTIMTLRQAFAILLSCLIYDHSLSSLSILGILLVFATLFIQTYTKCKKK